MTPTSMKEEAHITCLDVDCPERTGGKCNKGIAPTSNWREELVKKFFVYKLTDKFPDHVGAEKELIDFISSRFLPKDEVRVAIDELQKTKSFGDDNYDEIWDIALSDLKHKLGI